MQCFKQNLFLFKYHLRYTLCRLRAGKNIIPYFFRSSTAMQIRVQTLDSRTKKPISFTRLYDQVNEVTHLFPWKNIRKVLFYMCSSVKKGLDTSFFCEFCFFATLGKRHIKKILFDMFLLGGFDTWFYYEFCSIGIVIYLLMTLYLSIVKTHVWKILSLVLVNETLEITWLH